MLLLGVFSLSSCSKISEEGYDYYQNRDTEDLVKMASYDVWLELYGENSTLNEKCCVKDKEKSFPGRYKGISDGGGVVCDGNYPKEVCFTVIIKNDKEYKMAYDKYSTEIIEID